LFLGHYPITHSLVGGLAWSVLFGIVYYLLRRYPRGAWVVGAGVTPVQRDRYFNGTPPINSRRITAVPSVPTATSTDSRSLARSMRGPVPSGIK